MVEVQCEHVDPNLEIVCDPLVLGILDAPPPPAFDAITRLAVSLFNVPVALVTIVREAEDRQFFTSQQGLAAPWCDTRQTPLSHSFCQHVKRLGAPLVVPDAREDDLLQDNLAIPDLSVIGYLGVPIVAPDGVPLGALCVISDEPREWSGEDIDQLNDLARCVNDEVLLRATLLKTTEMYRSLEAANDQLGRYAAVRESISHAFMAPDLAIEDRFQELLRAGCQALNMDMGTIAQMSGGAADVLFHHPGGICEHAFDQTQPNISILFQRLADRVITGEKMVVLPDLTQSSRRASRTLTGKRPGAYAAAPLFLNGGLFGVIEFARDAPHENWSDEDHDLLSVITMFACAYLSAFQQINTLKKTSRAVLSDLA